MLSLSQQNTEYMKTIEDFRNQVDRFLMIRKINNPTTMYLYRKNLNKFFDWCETNNLDMAALTLDDVFAYSDYLAGLKLSNLSQASYLSVVKSFFSYLDCMGLYRDIAKMVKGAKRVNQTNKEDLSVKSCNELLSYFYNQGNNEKAMRDFAIAFLMIKCGLRCIEVSRAKIGDIVFKSTESGTRIVLNVWGKGREEQEKGKEENLVVLTPETYKPIRLYLDMYRKGATDDDYLFVSTSNRTKGAEEKQMTTRSISRIISEGLKAIGLDAKEYTAHSLRHTAGCQYVQNGSKEDAKVVLRHKRIETTEIYTKSLEQRERIENAPEFKLDGIFGPNNDNYFNQIISNGNNGLQRLGM